MVKGKEVFSYVGSTHGTNKDGERYFALNVMTKGVKKSKLSFVTKKLELMDKLVEMKFVDFQDVILVLDFSRNFNPKSRYFNWECELIDVLPNNTNTVR